MDYILLEKEYMAQTYKRQNVVIVQGKGACAIDDKGKTYIDFTSGIGVNSLGYAPSQILNAIVKQFNKVQHTSNIYYNEPSIELAKHLCEATNYKKVFLANSGAEANECAFKLVRKYHSDKNDGKTKILSLQNSFHGRTMATLTLTGQEIFHKDFNPFMQEVEYIGEDVDFSTFKNVGGIFIELVQGEGGVVPINKDFLARLVKFAKENDVLIVDDEVQTGIGRTGKVLCLEHFNIKPDIVTLAKGLGGGMPIGACLIGEKAENTFTYSSHGSTFGGNPISSSAAKVVLGEINKASFLSAVVEKGKYLKENIEAIKGVKAVTGLGLMIGIQLETKKAQEVVTGCMKKGLLVLTAKEKIRLLPPLNIEKKQIDAGLSILKEAIEN